MKIWTKSRKNCLVISSQTTAQIRGSRTLFRHRRLWSGRGSLQASSWAHPPTRYPKTPQRRKTWKCRGCL